ncbi:hypothetical protein HK099_000039 [Clydaea vesicula]|uniref:Uncharacterized protein n=1 Tax=Clydaea vesicula TaxID=447962 RepID=A0AAD5U8P6_9FUNG|nr:hypothetical protein HK099_000039 [Clydaea vesicula]
MEELFFDDAEKSISDFEFSNHSTERSSDSISIISSINEIVVDSLSPSTESKLTKDYNLEQLKQTESYTPDFNSVESNSNRNNSDILKETFKIINCASELSSVVKSEVSDEEFHSFDSELDFLNTSHNSFNPILKQEEMSSNKSEQLKSSSILGNNTENTDKIFNLIEHELSEEKYYSDEFETDTCSSPTNEFYLDAFDDTEFLAKEFSENNRHNFYSFNQPLSETMMNRLTKKNAALKIERCYTIDKSRKVSCNFLKETIEEIKFKTLTDIPNDNFVERLKSNMQVSREKAKFRMESNFLKNQVQKLKLKLLLQEDVIEKDYIRLIGELAYHLPNPNEDKHLIWKKLLEKFVNSNT